ncbi:MAG: tetratricopeptide repeat protein, partial [Chitinivibrionales bacterium]|nr:tetratricopeptide repeat protein [Chitinivibrionales bacterium]
LAHVYQKLGREKDVFDAYKKLVKLDPQNLEANKQLGLILVKNGQMSEGLIYLEMAKTLSPKDPQILLTLAQGYMKTNRLQEASDLLAKAKELQPDDLNIRFKLFELYNQLGQKKKAEDEIKQYVDKKRDPKAMLLYAGVLVDNEKYKEAENVIEDIKATQPENVDVLMLQAKIQRYKKKYDDAIETYKEITYIDKYANYAPALFERAETYMLVSKPMWAETFYKRTLQADPKFALAEYGLAKLCKLHKDGAGFKQHLDRALQIDPANKVIQDDLKNQKN